MNLQKAIGTNSMGNVQRFTAPLMNTIIGPHGTTGFLLNQGQTFHKKRYMRLARGSAEVMALAKLVVSDIMSDGVEFTPVDNNSGRNRVKKAEDFYKKQNVKDSLKASTYDVLFTGEGFCWKGNLSNEDIKEVCNNYASRYGLKNKEQESILSNLVYIKALRAVREKGVVVDEDNLLPRKFRNVPSTTVSIDHNGVEILGYEQEVGSNKVRFDTDEIIKFEFQEIDGRVEGFTSMESLVTQISLLGSMWENMNSFYKNGAQPDRIYMLKNDQPNNPNHNLLVDTLKKYKDVRNSHGSFVFTGDLDIQDLQQLDKMQMADMGLYITSILALSWGIPLARIPFLVGKSATSSDTGGAGDAGYWRNISESQAVLEDRMNSQFWEPFFGVRMTFKRSYLQDEVRETQVQKMKTDVVEQRIKLGMFSFDAAGRYLGIPKEDMGEKPDPMNMMGSGQLNQNLLNSNRIMEGEDNKVKREAKRTEQNGM
jgi:hypothetical protein